MIGIIIKMTKNNLNGSITHQMKLRIIFNFFKIVLRIIVYKSNDANYNCL